MTDDYSRSERASAFGAPLRPPGATWGPVALIVVTVVVSLVPLSSFLAGGSVDDEDVDRDTLLFAGLISLLWYSGIAAIVYMAARWTGGGWRNLGVRPPFFSRPNVFESARDAVARTLHLRLPRMVMVPLVGYPMAYIAVITYSIITVALGLDSLEPGEQIPSEVFDDKVVIAIMGAGVLVAAPVVEEIFFRGFLFGGLRRYVSFLPAAALSGVIFSLSHGDVGLVIPFTLVGIVLAYAYEKTGTLFGSISIHFVFNLVSFAVLLLVPEYREG
jgi:membrane protease YdiL (CAAX protease family)